MSQQTATEARPTPATKPTPTTPVAGNNQPELAEHTRPNPVFVPRTDIFEDAESIHVLAEMPGVDSSGLDITLEKNVLSIHGHAAEPTVCGVPVLAEYEVGDYQRSFTLSEYVDRDGIQASMKDGVLRLVLPKAKGAMARKIQVRSA